MTFPSSTLTMTSHCLLWKEDSDQSGKVLERLAWWPQRLLHPAPGVGLTNGFSVTLELVLLQKKNLVSSRILPIHTTNSMLGTILGIIDLFYISVLAQWMTGSQDERRWNRTKMSSTDWNAEDNSSRQNQEEWTQCQKNVKGCFTPFLSCECHDTESNTNMCDKYYGGCEWKTLVVGRQCDGCAPAAFGFSSSGCQRCDCHHLGSQDTSCD